MTPEEVIGEVKKANLREGAEVDFPRMEMGIDSLAPGQPKYVIVNCDEGDPGAFMDRALMEGNPHSVWRPDHRSVCC